MEPSPELMAFMARLLPPMTRAISLFIPGRDSRIAWQNAKNNAEIIQLVAHVSSVLPRPGEKASLPELVEKCYALGSFQALWAIEGLGHWYADSFYVRTEQPQNLLTAPPADALPPKCLTMMHAGIGMAFAKRALEKLKPKSPAAEIRRAVELVLALCRNSSREGYTGAAIESLGLATRFLHGAHMVKVVDEHLSRIDRELSGYLWHGAGRAIYFSPPNFIPGVRTPWRAVRMCRTEPPHDLGRRNAVAGFAWAVTLVNMRFPIIMETLLKYHGAEFTQDSSFSNGVLSSMIMRYDITPDDPHIQIFRDYRPSNPKLAETWDRLVKVPCDLALDRYYPLLKKHHRLEEVFRYQHLGALLTQLERTQVTSLRTSGKKP